MLERIITAYLEVFKNAGLKETYSTLLVNLSIIVVIVLLAVLADILTKRVLISVIKRIVKKSKNTYDDVFLQRRVFKRLAHIAPALVVHALIGNLVDSESLIAILRSTTDIYIILVAALVVDSTINAFHDIYLQLPVSKGRNIKGYVQVVKIIVYIAAVLVGISVATGKPINGLLVGIGTFAAVLILVFKDTILGLAASIQLSANKMVQVGDWISMPKYNADGDVIDIALNTVKVQNWDKTISTIPTYALVSDAFNNWRGMEESGGRRIKRSINIDMHSVRFVDEALLEKFKKFQVLSDYIEQKQKELDDYNKQTKANADLPINGRRMTNLGTFRKYLELYLQKHPNIHKEMTFLIRHLQPTEKGLPIEIYVFSNDQKWANYEAIQADIFDHVLAVVPEFDLKVFQNPSGEDWKRLLR